MSEPGHDTLFEWVAKTLAWLIGTAVSAVVAVGAWVSGKERTIRKDLGDRMEMIERDQEKYSDLHASHNTEFAVIHSNQDHMSNRMNELRIGVQGMHTKIDEMRSKVDEVLGEMRRPHTNNRGK